MARNKPKPNFMQYANKKSGPKKPAISIFGPSSRKSKTQTSGKVHGAKGKPTHTGKNNRYR